MAYQVRAGELKALGNDPDVEFVAPDREVFASLDNAVVTVGADFAASYGWNGEGIGIAVLDSGIRQHNEMSLS